MKKNVSKVKLIITSIIFLVVLAIGCSDGNNPSSSAPDKANNHENHDGHSH